MKLLFVCSQNSGSIAPFIVEQAESLSKLGVIVDFYSIRGKGIWGYLQNRKLLIQKITEFAPDIIHAHYGLSGLLANAQRHVPVITTYHGSDINEANIYPLSRLCMILSKHNIFVSEKNRLKSNQRTKCSVIPCGVDTSIFIPMEKAKAREELEINSDKKLILFAGAFANAIKNPDLAKSSVALLPNVDLMELKGYTRQEVAILLNAVDVLLLTSFTEGSPQIIKEAMACNCPIVSVDAGDVQNVIEGVDGCNISTYQSFDVAGKLKLSINFANKTAGRKRILALGLDIEKVAMKILEVYKKVQDKS